MDKILGVLLLINVIVTTILQNRYAANINKRPIRWRLHLSVSGFGLGFLSVVFFAVTDRGITSDILILAMLVGCFSAYGFGWLTPEKLRRIYQQRILNNAPNEDR